MPRKKEIIYPIFLECTPFCEDLFWESVFENLAYGKPPCGAYISKDFLCCSYKNKEFSYRIERKDSQILYQDVYRLLNKKMGVLSQREKIRQRLNFNKMEKIIHDSRQDWSNIRKNVRDVMYEKYVIEMKQKHGLSTQQTKYLLSAICISITFKTITQKDITFENERISSIDGVEFHHQNGQPTQIIMKKSMCPVITKRPKTIIVKKKKMDKEWTKYLKTKKNKKKSRK